MERFVGKRIDEIDINALYEDAESGCLDPSPPLTPTGYDSAEERARQNFDPWQHPWGPSDGPPLRPSSPDREATTSGPLVAPRPHFPTKPEAEARLGERGRRRMGKEGLRKHLHTFHQLKHTCSSLAGDLHTWQNPGDRLDDVAAQRVHEHVRRALNSIHQVASKCVREFWDECELHAPQTPGDFSARTYSVVVEKAHTTIVLPCEARRLDADDDSVMCVVCKERRREVGFVRRCNGLCSGHQCACGPIMCHQCTSRLLWDKTEGPFVGPIHECMPCPTCNANVCLADLQPYRWSPLVSLTTPTKDKADETARLLREVEDLRKRLQMYEDPAGRRPADKKRKSSAELVLSDDSDDKDPSKSRSSSSSSKRSSKRRRGSRVSVASHK